MKRRTFLKLTGTFFATASLAGGLASCGGDDDSPAPGPETSFPQGVASGDPRPTSVVLWTRAILASGATDTVALTVEVATDDTFATVVVSQAIEATAASDHTVRVVVEGLAADTIYFYRFSAGQSRIVGRTRTAPEADADIAVRLAWVSCQDYGAGTYAAYRQLVADDVARAEADQIRAVVHLGDFIYETRGDYFQKPLSDTLEPVTLTNPDGSPREVPAFPSGGGTAGGSNFARTLEDYRHLYKHFASDPDVMAARARWPFVHMWDDHEFTDDCWQSQANYTDENSTDEGSQSRKLVANQAWFEFLPVQLTGATGVAGVTQNAKDFTAATATDAAFTTPNDDNFVDEPNNVAAVGSITIYRSLRFGKHVELVITDERSYRSDHPVPEEFAAESIEYLHPRNVLPADDVDIMDAGRTYNGGKPPATVGISGKPNPRLDSPAGTMLGAEQKAWFKATMKGSTATWKVWANEVPLMRFFLPNGPIGGLIVDRVMSGDAWDGYPSERRELTTYLREEGVTNLLVLTGDIHAHFAGVVLDDFTGGKATPIGVELCAAGVSSNSLFSFYEYAARGASVPADARAAVTYDASASGGSPFVENFNLFLLHGPASAKAMAETNDLSVALAQSAPPNPHLRYADSNAQGFGVVLIGATQAEAQLVTMERPISNTASTVKRVASFTVPKDDPSGLTGPTITGTKPFPLV